MANFWELFKQSVIIQALLALVVICVEGFCVVYGLIATGAPLQAPNEWHLLTGAVVGFYFRQKAEVEIANQIKTALDAAQKQ